MKQQVSVENLRELLRLDSESGRLYWRNRGAHWFKDAATAKRWNTRYAEKEALTTVSAAGYRFGSLFHYPILAHRVVFAMANGRWPTGQVDHRDLDKSNNRPDNLREATHQQNKQNQGSSHGTSAYRGVSWNKQTGKWRATCNDSSGKHRTIGNFNSEEDAARARDAAARKWHGEFARLNYPPGVEQADTPAGFVGVIRCLWWGGGA